MQKFKNHEQLENAYLELEKRFTQKCQQLALLQKADGTSAKTETAPPQQSFEEFLEKYANAKSFSEQIKQNIAHPEYASRSDALEKCYLDILDKNYIGLNKLNDDGFVQEHVLSNDKIVEAVLNKVFSNGKGQAMPKTITGNGGGMSIMPPKQPKDLSEANALAEELFK